VLVAICGRYHVSLVLRAREKVTRGLGEGTEIAWMEILLDG